MVLHKPKGCILNRFPSIHRHNGKVARIFSGASYNPARAVSVMPIIGRDSYSAWPANSRRSTGLRNSSIR